MLYDLDKVSLPSVFRGVDEKKSAFLSRFRDSHVDETLVFLIPEKPVLCLRLQSDYCDLQTL